MKNASTASDVRSYYVQNVYGKYGKNRCSLLGIIYFIVCFPRNIAPCSLFKYYDISSQSKCFNISAAKLNGLIAVLKCEKLNSLGLFYHGLLYVKPKITFETLTNFTHQGWFVFIIVFSFCNVYINIKFLMRNFGLSRIFTSQRRLYQNAVIDVNSQNITVAKRSKIITSK